MVYLFRTKISYRPLIEGPSNLVPAYTFSLVLTTVVVNGCGIRSSCRTPRKAPAPVESMQDILKKTETSINQIKDEIFETAENIKNE